MTALLFQTGDIPESLLESQNEDLQFTVVLRYMCERFSTTSKHTVMSRSQLCFYTHHNPGSVLVWYQCHKNITAERKMHSVPGQTPASGSCPQSSLHSQLPAFPSDWQWHHQFIYNAPVPVTNKKWAPCPAPPAISLLGAYVSILVYVLHAGHGDDNALLWLAAAWHSCHSLLLTSRWLHTALLAALPCLAHHREKVIHRSIRWQLKQIGDSSLLHFIQNWQQFLHWLIR